MKTPVTRAVSIVAAFAAALFSGASAAAQPFPQRPITIIVPSSAGGSLDHVARLVSGSLSARLGQPVVIENVVGANGIIGTERVVRAAPDGYTLLAGVDSQIILAKLVTPSVVPYDAFKDLVPVGQLAVSTMVLAGRPGLEANTADELAALIRKSPGKISYASWGNGSAGHVVAEMIANRMGGAMLHVPYKGTGPIVVELASGRVDVAVLPAILAVQAQKTAPVKFYGVTNDQPWPLLKGVPTLGESPALKGFKYSVWYGLFAPTGTDPAVVERLSQALAETLKEPAIEEKLRTSSSLPIARTPADFAADLAWAQKETADVVKRANIKGE